MVTSVPPLPVLGATVMFDGGASVITSAPATMEALAPRFTAISFGPSDASGEMETSILALVDATEEIRPPNVGELRTTPEFEAENTTPAVMSSPPSVRDAFLPRATLIAKPGRVRLKPVALFGRVRMSAVATPFGVTLTVWASGRVDAPPK